MNALEILELAVENHYSDLFIVAGTQLSYKLNGQVYRMEGERLSSDDTRDLISQIYELAKHDFSKFHFDDDFSFSTKKGRFRVNVFMQRNSVAAVLRVVGYELPDPKDYRIGDSILNLAQLKKGLVLVAGPAGSGKSTTLACLIDQINKTRSGHVITIEDPIEYVHRHGNCIVSQREIEHDTEDYAHALRAALREAPDVILIGEMRDLDTIATAITAAETGHLVLSSVHTLGSAESIDRIIDVFPASQQQQIRVQLSMTLQAIISQQLLPTVDGKMVPAFEIMKCNTAISQQIRDNRCNQIRNSIQSGRNEGMQLMDDSLEQLVKEHIISRETALANAKDPLILKNKI